MNTNRLRTVHVVDDDEAVRRSLAALLVSRGYGVMPFASGEQFLADADLSRHGCVVLDLRMDGMSGLQVFEAMRARGSPLSVLFLSGHGDLPSAVQAMRDGAHDWLQKPCADDELIERIERILTKAGAAAARTRERDGALRLWVTLTPRERDVAQLVARGLANRVIAQQLPIDVRTVETNRARVFDKLGVANAVELANFVREHGLDDDDKTGD
jgi:FixJ family two-component response regulator